MDTFTESTADIARNLARIRDEISSAEKAAGRAEGSVRLCAVSKFHGADKVLAALSCGQMLFGENRVQEARDKFESVRMTLTRADPSANLPELHIIGHLQTNKVKKAVEISSCIQSVDSVELLREIEKRCGQLEKSIDVFLELRTGEDSKSGYAEPASLIESARSIAEGLCPHVTLRGLMTMAPLTDDTDLIRNSFRTLRCLKDEINSLFPDLPLTELSMGMSADFKIAVEEGSTMVRVGSAIFGGRGTAASPGEVLGNA